jgi:rare lipoprotein A
VLRTERKTTTPAPLAGPTQLFPRPGKLPRSATLAVIVAVALALSACGGAPSRPSKPGGYYLDDGPGTNPPADLDRVPDAVPRAEPINRHTSRPYTVLGTSYTPFAEPKPYKARGRASWYGRRYHGQKTSSGEVYDMYAMSAAHTLLPLPSYARVTNLQNGKSVVVRVNDRGPFHEDRIIDLSYAAAYKLGFVNQGSATVEVEAILMGESALPPPPPASSPPASPPPPTIAPVAVEAGGVYIQLGAFSVAENADAFLRRMRTDLDWIGETLRLHQREGLYRVHAGPYPDVEAAQRDADRIRQALGFTPFLIQR